MSSWGNYDDPRCDRCGNLVMQCTCEVPAIKRFGDALKEIQMAAVNPVNIKTPDLTTEIERLKARVSRLEWLTGHTPPSREGE